MWPLEKNTADPPAVKPRTSQIVKAAGMLFGNLDLVVFDPEIDCPPHACYNCWSPNHHIRDCREPKSREYCCNCGRKDVRVSECARCARSYFELDKYMRWWINRTFEKKMEDDEGKTIATDGGTADENWEGDEDQSFYSCVENGKAAAAKKNGCEKNEFGSEPPPVYTEPNHLFAYMRASKIRDDGVNLDETRMAERDSFGENSVMSDESSPKKDADEKGSSRASGEPINDFLSLMESVKHLSVSTQEVVVLQFMSERKKLSEMQSNGKE